MDLSDAAAAWQRDGFVVLSGFLGGPELDNLWTSRHAWGDRSFQPYWKPFAEQATMRQLLLFGFPPPGHPYWTPETINELRVRYPGLDTGQWRPEHPQTTGHRG